MSILLYRVDDRLIHGQVTVGWGRVLNFHRIILVDDDIAGNKWEIDLYRCSVPDGVEFDAYSVEDSVRNLPKDAKSEKRCLILMKDLATVEKMIRAGVTIPKLNLGGLHHSSKKRQITSYLYFNSEDLRIIDGIVKHGITVEALDLPGGDKKDVTQLLKNLIV